jgi:hypothetical protein
MIHKNRFIYLFKLGAKIYINVGINNIFLLNLAALHKC